jgi:integrase
MQLRNINVASIREYRIARLQGETKKGKRRSIGTVNRELSTLRAMLNEAIVNDWLKLNPFKRVRPGELISTADERKRTTVISFAEEARLLGECDGDYKRHLKAFLLGLLDTGARRGELFNVRKSDIHLDLDEMIVTSYKGKTVMRRPVPLTPRFKAALLDILERPGVATFKTGRKSKVKPDKDLVFGIRWTVQRSWEDVRSAANLTHVRLHDLRHTAATRLASRLSITEVGLILGHSDPRTTHRYVNRTPELVRHAGRVLHELQLENQQRSEAEVQEQTSTVN